MGAADPGAPRLGRADDGRAAATVVGLGRTRAGHSRRARRLGITGVARGFVTRGAAGRCAGVGRATVAGSHVGCTAGRTSSCCSPAWQSGTVVGLPSGAGAWQLADVGLTGLARTRGARRAFLGGAAAAAGAAASSAERAVLESAGLTLVGGGSPAGRACAGCASSGRAGRNRLGRIRRVGSRSAADGRSLLGSAGSAVVGHPEDRGAGGPGRAFLGGSARASPNPGVGRRAVRAATRTCRTPSGAAAGAGAASCVEPAFRSRVVAARDGPA